MKPQTIINIVFAVAFVGYVVSQRDPTFDTITCKEWRVVDAEGKMRIMAATFADGLVGVTWFDRDEKARIMAQTDADGVAGVVWFDKDANSRIAAVILANGTVELPTEDLTPPKKP